MSSDLVQARYDELERVASSFQRQAEVTADLDRRLLACLTNLEQDGWLGLGASAFFNEMRGEILPAVGRLTEALNVGFSVTQEISTTMRLAEDEAARLFGGQHEGSEGSGNGLVDSGMASSIALIGGRAIAAIAELVQKAWKGQEHNFSFLQFDQKTQKLGIIGKYGVRYPLVDKTMYNLSRDKNNHWKIDAGTLKAGVGAEVGWNEKGTFESLFGLYGEGSALKAQGQWMLSSDDDLGIAADLEVKVLSGDVLVGWNGKEFGLSAGINIASVKGEISKNIAGYNVGVNAEVGLKWEIGFSGSSEGIQVKMPFVSFGLGFGSAKQGQVT